MGKVEKKRRIKALVGKAILNVQKVGTIQITAPLGVKIDNQTGEVKTPLELKLIDAPQFTPTIVPDKLINHGLQKACLVIKKSSDKDCALALSAKINLDIPIFSMHNVPKLKPGDHIQEKAEVESIDIRGILAPNYHKCEKKNLLLISVVYKVKITIASEEIIRIPHHCNWTTASEFSRDYDEEDLILNKNKINLVIQPCPDCDEIDEEIYY